MSLYQVGCAQAGLIRVEGASQEQAPKKNGKMTIFIMLGLTGLIYIGIPAMRRAS